jgi:hypothetical protein
VDVRCTSAVCAPSDYMPRLIESLEFVGGGHTRNR